MATFDPKQPIRWRRYEIRRDDWPWRIVVEDVFEVYFEVRKHEDYEYANFSWTLSHRTFEMLDAYRAHQGGRTGIMTVLVPALKEALRLVLEENLESGTYPMIQVKGTETRARLYETWTDVTPEGYEARAVEHGIEFYVKQND